MICPCYIVWIYVDIPDCCRYIHIVMINAWKHVTTIFDNSTYVLNVSFHIMRSNIIMSFNWSKFYIIHGYVSDIAIKWCINISGRNSFEYHLYNQTGLNNILQTMYVGRIRYMLKSTRLCIILHKVWYRIKESQILWWKIKPLFWHENDNHDFLFDNNPYYTVQLTTWKIVTNHTMT